MKQSLLLDRCVSMRERLYTYTQRLAQLGTVAHHAGHGARGHVPQQFDAAV